MKTLKIIAVLVLLLAAAAAGAAPAPLMGTSDGHDLDALYTRAQQTYDLTQEDAVVLLDSRTVSVGDEGTVVTRVHTVVWIGTSQGIRHYADLRIPWNSATSTLDVEMLRTWRDGQWWPDPQRISDTAVVETLPYAAAQADDYTSLRETMLLHDGVELPCILETAYTLAVQGPPTAGADDVHVFPGRDPVLEADYEVRAPLGTDVKYASLNGAPEPVVGEDELRTLTWTVSNAGKLKLPVLDQPAAYEPAVVWTTWESWDALLVQFDAAVDAAAVAGPALTDSVAALVRGVPDGIDRVKKVIDFAEKSVRLVHTDVAPWLLAPRPAQRTYETGYGHALDRAVFTAALLKALPTSRITLCPCPRAVLAHGGFERVAPDLPRLADFGTVVATLGDAFRTFDYDPIAERILSLDRIPGIKAKLPLASEKADLSDHCSVDLSLVPGPDEWSGTGQMQVDMACFDSALWETSEKSVAAKVEDMIEGLLPDITVEDVQMGSGGGRSLVVRFTVGFPAPEEAADGMLHLVVGSPAAGIVNHLPHDIQAGAADHASPVRLPNEMVQELTLRLEVGDRTVDWMPQAVARSSSAGEFKLAVEQGQGWLTYSRSLQLDGIVERTWPDLRALLLEEQDPANGTIVLEPKKK